MALKTASTVASGSEIVLYRSPVSRMRAYSQAATGAVALDADITVVMAGLASLQISAGLTGMVSGPLVRRHDTAGVAGLALRRVERLMGRSGRSQFDVAELATVRLELDPVAWEFGVTFCAVLLVVATSACLRIILCLERVQCKEVAAVAFGLIIPSKILGSEIHACPTALMTVQAPGLLVAFLAVVAGLACHNPVAAHPVGVVVQAHTFAIMAGVAILDFHGGVLGVSGFLFSIRLLLEIHQSASQKRNYEKYLFH